MCLTARGALTGRVSSVHSNYHIPISNTADGLLVLKSRCASSPSIIGVSD
jgi:protocatechuate 4,5-dioxygenase beta chain